MNARVPRSRVTHDRWLVSYADFITLLFGFFVVLYAFARADQKKQAQVSQAIDSAFRSLGIFPDGANREANAPDESEAARASNQRDERRGARAGRGEGRSGPHPARSGGDALRQVAAHTVSIEMGRDGLVISLREAGFFDSGSARSQAGGAADAAPDRRQRWAARPTICASRATPTMCPSTPRSSTPTGSSPRRAPRTLRGCFWT